MPTPEAGTHDLPVYSRRELLWRFLAVPAGAAISSLISGCKLEQPNNPPLVIGVYPNYPIEHPSVDGEE